MTLTTNTQRVIVERHHGWEGASPSLLARVFDTAHQHISAIVAKSCAGCGRHICGCPDPIYSGVIPSDGPPVAPSRAAVEVGRAGISHPTPPEMR